VIALFVHAAVDDEDEDVEVVDALVTVDDVGDEEPLLEQAPRRAAPRRTLTARQPTVLFRSMRTLPPRRPF
jgi:hypothetical protein